MQASRQLPISERFFHLYESACRAIEQGTPDLADKLLEQAADECPEVFIGLAQEYRKMGNFNEAFRWSMLALTHAKRSRTKAHCWKNAGVLLAGIGEEEKAEECFREGLKIDKREPELLCNLALCLQWRNQRAEALKIIGRVIQNDPVNYQAIFTRAMLLLAAGDLVQGFKDYESRFKNPAGKVEKLKTDKPEWRGERGRVLVVCEQGVGDTIMMARYLKSIPNPVLRCQKRLKSLLGQTWGGELAVEEDEKLPEFDYHIATMSLPFHFKTTLATIPEAPYLVARTPWQLEGRFKVGISWAGSIDHVRDIFRSTELPQWKEILAVPGVTFYSLQVGIRAMDLIGSDVPIADLSPRIKNWADTANAIAGLDLVISVDTGTVHLAGAMGKPCWVLLPFSADWRWMLNRTDSPWYPSLTLCRQRAPKEWEPLLGSVAELLRARVSQGSLTVAPDTDHPEAVPL